MRKRGTPKAEWADIYPAWHHDPEICLQVADMAIEVNGDDDGVWATRALPLPLTPAPTPNPNP